MLFSIHYKNIEYFLGLTKRLLRQSRILPPQGPRSSSKKIDLEQKLMTCIDRRSKSNPTNGSACYVTNLSAKTLSILIAKYVSNALN